MDEACGLAMGGGMLYLHAWANDDFLSYIFLDSNIWSYGMSMLASPWFKKVLFTPLTNSKGCSFPSCNCSIIFTVAFIINSMSVSLLVFNTWRDLSSGSCTCGGVRYGQWYNPDPSFDGRGGGAVV